MGNDREQVSGLKRHVGYWMRYVSNHVSHAFGRKVEARGVTVAEWVVLREMFEARPISPSELAAQIGMTRGAISKLVDRLVSKKLVKRSLSDEDRRYQSIALTAAAKKLVPELAKLADENDREFFGHLTAEQQEALVATLQECVRRHGWKDLPVN